MKFSEPIKCDNKTTAQDITIDNKIVGALLTRRNGLLEPFTEWYQKLVPESHKNYFDWFYESEESGFIFGCFKLENKQKFLNYIKKF